MPLPTYIICAVFILFMNIVSYFMIRNVIWSIACSERNLKKMRTVAKEKKFRDRIKMKYLIEYSPNHKKEFSFWMIVKLLFCIYTAVMIALSIIFGIMYATISAISEIFIIAYGVISFALFIIFCFQEDGCRMTKYDRERLNRTRKDI